MSEFLYKQRKNILLLLAEEFETNVSSSDKIKAIIQAIKNANDYDEQMAKNFLDRILSEEEDRKSEQLAREEKEREREEKEREREEKEKERNFELEKLRLQNIAEANSIASTVSIPIENREKKVRLKDLVPKFDQKSMDITLFFLIFERQAMKENVEESNWVSQLIPLLPPEIVEIIVKEPIEKSDDYKYVKKLLLKRFKLSAFALKNKFEEHNRKPGALWTELVYELKGYLDNWLEAVEVDNFEDLKELMLLEQVKKRVPFEIKQQYMDSWENFKSASELADKCDHYDMIRRNNRMSENKIWDKKNFVKDKMGNLKSKSDYKNKFEREVKKDNGKNEQRDKEKFFERKKKIYYFSHAEGHIRPVCPELKNRH